MAYRVSIPAPVRERVTRRVRIGTTFVPDGRVQRKLRVSVFIPRGTQQGGGGPAGQLNRGFN